MWAVLIFSNFIFLNQFHRALCTFVWRKIEPKIASVEKKWQISGMKISSIFTYIKQGCLRRDMYLLDQNQTRKPHIQLRLLILSLGWMNYWNQVQFTFRKWTLFSVFKHTLIFLVHCFTFSLCYPNVENWLTFDPLSMQPPSPWIISPNLGYLIYLGYFDIWSIFNFPHPFPWIISLHFWTLNVTAIAFMRLCGKIEPKILKNGPL